MHGGRGATALPDELDKPCEAFCLVDDVDERADAVAMALAHGVGDVLLRVVDRLRGAERAQARLVAGLCRRKHRRATAGGELHRVAPYPAVGSDHQHGVTRLRVD